MAGKKSKAYVPSVTDAAVKAKTGRDWAGWFGLLDRAGAAKLEHQAIAEMLDSQYGVRSWWRQMVTVEYERARGLRAHHETATGFSVSVSKTLATKLATLYEATANGAKRKKWFPKGEFALSSQTKEKYFRGAWNGSARVDMGFVAKGVGKAQIAIQIGKLADRRAVDAERSQWRAALSKLQVMLEGHSPSASRPR
jgi:hypothetical protein